MPTFLELPPELHLKIFRCFDNRRDLITVSETCKRLHAIKRSGYWESTLRAVYRRETRNNVTPELHGIWKIRKLKASVGDDKKELLKMSEQFRLHSSAPQLLPNFDQEAAGSAYIEDLLDIRRIIRWFTRRFFEVNIDLQAAMSVVHYITGGPGPIPTKIADVEDAVCLVWLWIEASFLPCQRSTHSIYPLLSWALSGSDRQARKQDFSTIYYVQGHLRAQLDGASQLYIHVTTTEPAYHWTVTLVSRLTFMYSEPNLVLDAFSYQDWREYFSICSAIMSAVKKMLRKEVIVGLPLDVKIELLKHASPKDQASLTLTCKSFYEISKTAYWHSIRLAAFHNAIPSCITRELIGLWRLRKLKAEKTTDELLCAWSAEQRMRLPRYESFLGTQEWLDELASLQDLVHWFTMRLFESRRKQQLSVNNPKPPPTSEQVSDIYSSFCILWMWMEACYDARRTRYWGHSVAQLVFQWALLDLDRYPSARLHKWFTLRKALNFLLSELGPLIKFQIWRIPDADGELEPTNKETFRPWVAECKKCNQCTECYRSLGPAHLFLTKFGFDGAKSLLESLDSEEIITAQAYKADKKRYQTRSRGEVEWSDQLLHPKFLTMNPAAKWTRVASGWREDLRRPERPEIPDPLTQNQDLCNCALLP
ncbi:hypothetical protein ABW21_db0204585 [Orbilia brochopaga]|nr:hypothetical protein ABW21_db0204585 [Drechslerella brochopaga]